MDKTVENTLQPSGACLSESLEHLADGCTFGWNMLAACSQNLTRPNQSFENSENNNVYLKQCTSIKKIHFNCLFSRCEK